jgi:hypothetical protein
MYLEMAGFPEKLPWEMPKMPKMPKIFKEVKENGSTKDDINQERCLAKSLENVRKYITRLGKIETNNILAFMEICYEMSYCETIEYGEWIERFSKNDFPAKY